MTPALTLDEFTAALREAFPGATVVDDYTRSGRAYQCHAATLCLHGEEFAVNYNSDPLETGNRWMVEHAISSHVAAAHELRPLITQSARFRAKYARVDAAELITKAERLEAAAKLIEVSP